MIKVLLQHNDISKKSSKWRELFPERYIKFFDLIEDRDLENDELLYTMPLVIGDFQDPEIRKWQWYSCKLSDHGFEIVMEGRFNPMFLWFIHYLGIPYSKIWLTSDTREKYQFRTIKDVTTYKKIE